MILKPSFLAGRSAGTNRLVNGNPVDCSRRRFVQGIAAGSGLLASGMGTAVMAGSNGNRPQQVLSGNYFKLTYDYQKVNFTGRERLATAINGSVPAPVLRWKQGESVTLDVTNNLAEDTSIHWHGLILPSAMDGVPHISENFAGRFDLREGDSLPLPTAQGEVAFTIAGVFHDYSEDRGRVFITRENYDRHWPEKRYHSVAVYLKPEHRGDATELAEAIRKKFGALGEYSIFTNATIRDKIFEVFDQTFAITYVLRTIAIAVAVIGIVLTLTTLTSERSREIGVLRAVGASRGQVCGTYLTEASLIGLFASTIGLVCGVLLAMILTWVVNRAFFQWTIHFEIPWSEIAWTPLWVTAVALAAGIFPSLRAGSQPIARAVRTE